MTGASSPRQPPARRRSSRELSRPTASQPPQRHPFSICRPCATARRVPALVEHFNLKFPPPTTAEPKRFDPDALDALRGYSCPPRPANSQHVERVVSCTRSRGCVRPNLPRVGGEEPPPAASFKFSSFRRPTGAPARVSSAASWPRPRARHARRRTARHGSQPPLYRRSALTSACELAASETT